MSPDEIRRVAAPHRSDGPEQAEIRAWLRSQPAHELWGLTPATRVAWLLKGLDAVDGIER